MKLPAWTKRAQPLDFEKIKTCFTPQVESCQNMDALTYTHRDEETHEQKRTRTRRYTYTHVCGVSRLYVHDVQARVCACRCMCMRISVRRVDPT
jgi:hypothetical protein